MKNSNDTIGSRTRDLPACGAVPQLTAQPRAPINLREIYNFLIPEISLTTTRRNVNNQGELPR